MARRRAAALVLLAAALAGVGLLLALRNGARDTVRAFGRTLSVPAEAHDVQAGAGPVAAPGLPIVAETVSRTEPEPPDPPVPEPEPPDAPVPDAEPEPIV